MKIYTRTGDSGETSLFNGKRVAKSSSIIELLGNMDELNAAIGMLASYNVENKEIADFLARIQNVIFEIGADIATPDIPADTQKNFDEEVTTLEKQMDSMDAELKPLKNFILPGGSLSSAQSHFCRVLARRCERVFFGLPYQQNHEESAGSASLSPNPSIGRYLNRLSDYLFILARYLNKLEGVDDVLWKSGS